jgi:ubiquinone/menaquinone biosynthesis C-methylase UbiE
MSDRVFNHTHAHKLEDPERLKWMPTTEVLSRLHLAKGAHIADIGAGTGYFAIPMARAVGDAGHVLAIDLQPEMLQLLQQKLDEPDAPVNISPRRGSASKLPLEDRIVDLAFYANIWHELEEDDQDAALREAARVAVPGGKIAILDWRRDKQSPPGPPQDHRIAAETIMNLLQTNGCHRVACYNIGEFSYLVTAELPQDVG